VSVLGWITEPGWDAVVDAIAALRDPDVTLLYVTDEDIVGAPRGALDGLLGRRHDHELESRLAGLTAAAAAALLEDAADRLGIPARRLARTGRVEQEVLAWPAPSSCW
jgi:hypothetical protein